MVDQRAHAEHAEARGTTPSITGPKNRPTRSVPWRWMANTPTSVATVSGTTYGVSSGVATLNPSIALEHGDGRRDHAVAVEQRRAEDAHQHQHGGAGSGRDSRAGRSAVSARMPPSPWLSARITMATYFSEMTSSSE